MIAHILKTIIKRKTTTRLLVIEFAIAFLTLFATGVFIARYISNYQKPLGFKYSNVLQLDFQNLKGEDWDAQKVMIQSFADLFKSFPEVEHVAFYDRNVPFQPKNYTELLDIKYQNTVIRRAKAAMSDNNLAAALSIKINEGRWFQNTDYTMKYLPIVINQNLKDKLFGRKNALGETILLHKEPATIVGVIEDFRYAGDFSDAGPFFFIQSFFNVETTYNQDLQIDANNSDYNCPAIIYLKLKDGIGLDFENRLKQTINTKLPDWDFRIYKMENVRKTYIKRVWLPIFLVSLVVGFLLINIVLGLFGVLWYNISLRKSEIGLRMAVGANKKNIYRQFIGEMLILATLGILPGIIIAAQFTFLKVFDIENKVFIIAMLAATIIIYLLVMLCALLPAAQAAKIQPAMALHEE
ncbi:MAG: FtsX-like permease family protein [Bacteroidales bacterium]